MRIQAETLFIHDEEGRLRYLNYPRDPELHPTPLFFLGRTKADHICRFRYDLPEEICGKLAALAASVSHYTDLCTPPDHLEAFKDILCSYTEVRTIWAGPAYRFPETLVATPDTVEIDRHNAALLLSFGFPDMLDEGELESVQPCIGATANGKVVSICQSVRQSTRAEEAGVDTLPPYRRKGCAVQATSGWATAVRDRGRIPLYSTSWDNKASQGVARKLGLALYGTDLHFT